MSEQKPAKKEYECKHALYFTANDGSNNDLNLVKGYTYHEDGTRTPTLLQLYNYKRPFYITQEGYRNHKDKKEWEDISKVRKFESTDIDLAASVSRALGRPAGGRLDLRQICQSPYVYGTDVTAPVLIKHHYLSRWPHRVSDNIVAVLDSETDMVEGTGEILMLGLTCKEKAKLCVTKKFLRGIDNPEQAIQDAFVKYLGEYIEKRKIKLEVEILDTPGQVVASIIKSAHEWKPDFLAAWNIDYDFPVMEKALVNEGYNVADVFSDPSIPREFRQYEYKQGPAQKVTSSGKTMALSAAERWHEVRCPASWYVLDPMCVYLKLRIAGGKEPSYSLDSILQKHLGIRKLKFKEADHLSGPSWHKFMQTEYRIEYCIYNLFDCIGVELLDEVTTDLRSMVSLMTDHSEYRRFPSQPRRTWDDLNFMVQEHGKVAGSTSNKMVDENDQYVIGGDDWIVTLRSELVHDMGECLFEDLPEVRSLMRGQNADLDVEGTYPNEEIIMNISKETTAQELCSIRGVPEIVRRSVGVNLSGGHVNATEICRQIYQAPSFYQLLESMEREVA